ncbi:hypothetical protein [Streptomyces sp. Amel2xE9]|uniref:hypothetical protein n=1 Tax=Streptomyces sp. Amel2xE9 TaxID=1157634 RepID=UPI0003802DF3
MAVWLCAVAVLTLGACGTQVAGRDGGSPSPAVSTPIPWTTTQPSAVTGVRIGDDRRTLLLDTQVPTGPRACVRDLEAVLTEPMCDLVRVQITFVSPSGDRASGCTKERSATARLTLPEPLGGRDVVVDDYTRFTADGAKPPALRLCGKLGCTPPVTGCTAGSYEQALTTVDAPRHTYRKAERCDGKWLVLDISWRTGPACAGSPEPACSARLGDRWFFRAKKSGWEPIARTTDGGCRAVRQRESAFPVSLCASPAPLPPSPHPSHAPSSASPTPAS